MGAHASIVADAQQEFVSQKAALTSLAEAASQEALLVRQAVEHTYAEGHELRQGVQEMTTQLENLKQEAGLEFERHCSEFQAHRGAFENLNA